MDIACPLFFVALAAVIVWVVTAALLKARRRAEDIRVVGEQLGLPYFPKGDPALISELSRFKLFSLGSSTKVRNMLCGTTEEVEVAIFDYQYTTGGEENAETMHQSVISFRSPLLNLPDFTLRPENLLHRIGQFFGYSDIDFESHPVFSKAFLLRGSEEQQIREVFNDEILAFFEGAIGVCAEAAGERLIFYRTAVRVEPANLRSFMDEGFQIYSLFRSPSTAPDQAVDDPTADG